jgi:hypothetical protein
MTTPRTRPVIGLLVAGLMLGGLAACGGVDVVDSGTYDGVVDQVKPGEREIYVVLDDGRKLELYFTDQTTLQQSGQPVEFSALEAGSQVRVAVEREGNRNVPTRVEILP